MALSSTSLRLSRKGIVLAAALLAAGTARATTMTVTSTGTTSGGSVSGSAVITTGSQQVSVTLNNLTQNPTSVAQLLSGITFTLSGSTATGAVTVGSVNDPNGYANIAADGTYTQLFTPNLDLTRWQATGSGGAITMTTLSGGNPDRLIIGPDSAGGFTGAGTYSNANAGVRNDNPSVLGSLTFTLTGLTGVTVNSTISNVVFQWGTSVGGNTTTGNIPPPPGVPDGGTTALLLGGALAALGLARRRF